MLLRWWLRGQVVASGWSCFDVGSIFAMLVATASLVERVGVAFLIDGVRRIKQFVEVEILKNFSRLLFILLGLEILVFISVRLATSSALLVWADALAHEPVMLTSAVKLGVFDELLEAVLAAVVLFPIPAGIHVANMFLGLAGLLFEIRAGVFSILLTFTEN